MEERGNGETKDSIVVCEGCEEVFVAEIDVDGSIRVLGLSGEDCCEGYGFEEVEAEVPDEFADD